MICATGGEKHKSKKNDEKYKSQRTDERTIAREIRARNPSQKRSAASTAGAASRRRKKIDMGSRIKGACSTPPRGRGSEDDRGFARASPPRSPCRLDPPWPAPTPPRASGAAATSGR